MGEHQIPLSHYDINGLAKSLKVASIDIINTANIDIESHWFRSLGPADLYYWKAGDKIVKHQLNLFGQVVEWNEFDGVKTGYVYEDEEEYGSDVVRFDKLVNKKAITQAIEFLKIAQVIDQKVRKQLISHYEFYNRWQGWTPRSILSRFFKQFRKKS